ncbi:MAG TPA: tlde1 domain-containing protein [Candidatus Sulfotelmatobacter sp.]
MNAEKNLAETPADNISENGWTYVQKTGALLRNNQPIGTGYSGFDNGKNNPDMQAVPNVGPVPQGSWTIVGPPFNSPEHGPYVMRLAPDKNTHTFGRNGFLLHGDSIEAPGCGSRGCIIMPRAVRELVWQSGETSLEVVAEFQTQDVPEGPPRNDPADNARPENDLPEAASAS